MKQILYTMFILISLTLQSCTIAHHKLRNTLSDSNQANMPDCNIKFSLNIESHFHTNTYGTKKSGNDKLHEMKGNYIVATKEALNELGCKSTHTNSFNSANLMIKIWRQQQVSALPQEWLTGLSFGQIPSWGTRKNEYIYSFTNREKGKSQNYTVDTKSYNHLYLFPVSWITFYTADEYRTYKKAITNFIKNA